MNEAPPRVRGPAVGVTKRDIARLYRFKNALHEHERALARCVEHRGASPFAELAKQTEMRANEAAVILFEELIRTASPD